VTAARRDPSHGEVSPAAAAAPSPSLPGLHARVLDQIGTAICSGEMITGDLLYIDDLAERYSVSRSVVREALRVLSSMGMVESRRRLGTRIRPSSRWNVYDPHVIRWRLASRQRNTQLRSMTELRTAVEPQAARLAAERTSADAGSDLVSTAAKMWAAGQRGDQEEFLRLDIDFHRQVLAGSGNDMFVKLHELVAEVLAGRTHYGLMPRYPDEAALRLHADVAQAIQRRDGARAHKAMAGIMEQALDEMKSMWDDGPDGSADG
jgi:DNA-binding FadR family transcriptional regulator